MRRRILPNSVHRNPSYYPPSSTYYPPVILLPSLGILLADAAALVTVGGGVFGTLRYVRHRRANAIQQSSNGALRGVAFDTGPHDFELLPFRFEVQLAQEIPTIEVYVYAINYARKKIVVTRMDVGEFRVENCVPIHGIGLIEEWDILPQRSRLLIAKRALVDSEARAITKGTLPSPCVRASFTLPSLPI
jgi:hypothetical protein